MKTLKITISIFAIFLISSIYSQSWYPVQTGANQRFISAVKLNPNEYIISGDSGSVYKTTNRGVNWFQISQLNNTSLYELTFSGNIGLARMRSTSGIYRTSNGGYNWSSVAYFGGQFSDYMKIQLTDNYIGYALVSIFEFGVTREKLYKTTNSGYNWFEIRSFSHSGIYSMYFTSPYTGYITGDTGGILKTTNGGNTWFQVYSGVTPSLIYFANDNTGFGINSGPSYNVICKTTDAGSSWIMQTLPNPVSYLNSCDFSDPSNGIIVGDQGSVYMTSNGGTNWLKHQVGYTYFLSTIMIENQNAIIPTSSGIVMKYGNMVGVNQQSNETPSDFSLSQNYPNPFNPSTKISFSIPKSSFVKMAVYDVTGKEVEILVNENMNAGSFEVDFNASKLTSGVYFCRITADGFTDVKKMMLIK